MNEKISLLVAPRKTDLYLCLPTRSKCLGMIQIFDGKFLYDDENTYFGYLGVSVDRVKLVSVVVDLRIRKIECFGVPVEYRELENITSEDARILAEIFAKSIGASILNLKNPQKFPPVYWAFDLKHESENAEKAGGIVMIDRLDGHVWTNSENEEYMYDYNNLL